MKEILKSLELWRGERGLMQLYNEDIFKHKIYEELSEIFKAKSENDIEGIIDGLCDIIVFAINEDDRIQSDNDFLNGWFEADKTSQKYDFRSLEILSIARVNIPFIIFISFDLIEIYGHDAIECLKETIKEISSRKQDPKQKRDWEFNGVSGKWQKDINQDPKTLYKANYSKCIKSYDD